MAGKKYEVIVNKAWCKACGICVALCPVKVFITDIEGRAEPSFSGQCIGCRICVVHCPDFCITVREADNGK